MPTVPKPEAHSSVDAVLRHSAEVVLLDEQRVKLQAIDDKLTEQRQQAREQLKSSAPSTDSPPPRTSGFGRGGGRRGNPSYGGGGGQRQVDNRRAAREKMDSLDSAAFLEAEAVLDEQQKPAARKIASDYREQLFNYRQAKDNGETGED
jgi:hypothetical protein